MGIETIKLTENLKNLGLHQRNFSILGKVKPDCFNLINTINNEYEVFYMDDRGNKLHTSEFYSLEDAGEYLIELVKLLQY